MHDPVRQNGVMRKEVYLHVMHDPVIQNGVIRKEVYTPSVMSSNKTRE